MAFLVVGVRASDGANRISRTKREEIEKKQKQIKVQ